MSDILEPRTLSDVVRDLGNAVDNLNEKVTSLTLATNNLSERVDEMRMDRSQENKLHEFDAKLIALKTEVESRYAEQERVAKRNEMWIKAVAAVVSILTFGFGLFEFAAKIAH